MDPSMFFGRARVTRHTLQSKQLTSSKESENCEVKKDAPTEIFRRPVKSRKAKLATAGKENDAVQGSTPKRTSKRVKPPVKKKEDDLKSQISKPQPGKKSQIVHFEAPHDATSPEGPSGGKTEEAAPSGPVYRNVRRSDVVGDPCDEYDFPMGSDSSPEKSKKKKTSRRAKPVKKAGGVVLWDPSKRPINLKAKPTKKKAVQTKDLAVTSTNQTATVPTNQFSKVACSSKSSVENSVTGNPPVPPSSLKCVVKNPVTANPSILPSSSKSGAKNPLTANPPVLLTSLKRSVEKTANSNRPVLSKPQLLPDATTPELNGVKPFTSTPVLKQQSTKRTLSVQASSSSGSKANESLVALPSVKRRALPVPSISVSCALNESFEPSSPSINAGIQFSSTPTNDALSCSKPRSAQVSSRWSSSLPLPAFSVRESPSFRETSEVLESPHRSSFGLPGTECPKILDAVTSTPVTRSRKANEEALKSSTAVNFDEPSASNSKVTFRSPVTIPDLPEKVSMHTENESDGDLSGIFDDMPRTSVIPTRMFSTNRGTIYVPEGLKRKLPELSPSKERSSSRVTVVKFSAPQTSSGLEQCFGFDEMGEDGFVPQPNNVNKATFRKAPIRKPNLTIPNLTIQEVQAILRGQSKLASPANITPRSIQTKLTDFVSSTPTSTPVRILPVSNQEVLTPTPVALFGEEHLETDLVSPFTQPSRRSYDRFRPVKRVAYGDEVHSGDEEDTNEQNFTESAVPEKKKGKSYKRTKKPKDTQLDAWASKIASHFDEVEEVELQVE